MHSIVFDMDGVLIDSERLVLRSWERVAERHGLSGMKDLFYQCVGVTHARTRILFTEHYGTILDYDAFRDEVRACYMAYTQTGIPIKKGAVELLEWLHQGGWHIGLASSSREDSVRRTMEMTGMGRFFRTLVCGDMLAASKPEPDIYLRACSELGADPAHTFAVEDSRNGIVSASRAGMIPLLVPDMIAPTDEMLHLSAAVFPDLLAVKDWLATQVQIHR